MTQPEGLKDREQRAREWLKDSLGEEWSADDIWTMAKFAESEVARERDDRFAQSVEEYADAGRLEFSANAIAAAEQRAEQAQQRVTALEAGLAEAERERDEARAMGAEDYARMIQRNIEPLDMQAEATRYGLLIGDSVYLAVPKMAAERDAALADAARLRAHGFPRNALVSDACGFMGDWIAVPAEDFNAYRAALASTDGNWLESKLGPLREFAAYIADSPAPEYGGFSIEAVARAKDAIRALDRTPPRAAGGTNEAQD